MSLLDSLVLDSLLNPPVVTQEIWLANRADAPGSGTQADPYQAGGSATDSDPILDKVMRIIVAGLGSNGMTVRLQPGTYYTKGFNPDYTPTQGWKAASKLRIVGSGIGVTKLVLTSNLSNTYNLTAAIGCNTTSTGDFIDGFEVSDLTIDANLVGNTSATQLAVGGVSVSGTNIFVRRVEVINLGNKGTSPAPFTSTGIQVARAWTGKEPYNCVIDQCVVRSPVDTVTNGTVGLAVASDQSGSTAYHTLCVIRNCYVDFGATTSTALAKNYLGIVAGGGIGTIVECNQVRNCQFGATWVCNGTAKDVVFRANTFVNVPKCFVDPASAYIGFDRAIFLNNTAEWPDSSTFSAPIGLKLDGNSGSSTTVYKDTICRGNTFRRPVGTSSNNSEVGLSFKNCTNVVVENNIADVGTAVNSAVTYSVSSKVTAFNNKKPDGTFVAAYNSATSLHLSEITTDVEDAILSI